MKKRVKSFLSILLTLVLVIGSPGIDVITVSAEESADASYVLHYDSGEDGVKTYVYAALQNIDHSYEDSEANTKWNYTHTCAVFNLVNTTNGGSIAAYCTDVDTSAKSDTYYRRINLEDSSYHADGSAAKIRSIVLNSFPYKYDETTISGLQDDVNNWLESQSETKVEDLTVGDALTATQLAIWKLTHGDKYTVGDFYSGWGLEYSSADALNALKGRSIYTENLTENNPNSDETTEANVRLLYNYLMSLEGTDPKDDAISEFSFENIHFDITENETSYDVTVYVTVNATIDSSDDLTLAAVCGGTTQEKNLTQAGEYSFTFSGLTDLTEITLKITGTQTGGDVYLFDAVGDRSTSQSLVGYDASALPVYGEITVNPGVIHIHKTAEDGTAPLKNISFKIYKAGTLEDYQNNKLQDAESYVDEQNLVATVTTDENGNASYVFDVADGVYVVAELENAAVEAPVNPFFAAVPAVDSEADTYDYTVTVELKNTVKKDNVDIDKDVTEIGQDSDTFDVNETHTWIIQSAIPNGMAEGLNYEISDNLDSRLTYKGNIVVTVASTGESEDAAKAEDKNHILTENTDYEITEIRSGDVVTGFKVSLTSEGRKKVAQIAAADFNNYEVRVYFDTVINATAGMGEPITNDAHIDFTNNVGIMYSDDSDKPYVYTCGVNIIKRSTESSKALAGAAFKIARVVEEETENTLTIDDEREYVEYVEFYNNAELKDDADKKGKVSEVTTGEDGTAVIYGLAAGTYYLVETKAPDGYNLLTAPVKVELDETSHIINSTDDGDDTDDAENGYVVVKNSSKFVLPATGGMGTTVFTVFGIVLISAAFMVLAFSGKKKEYRSYKANSL